VVDFERFVIRLSACKRKIRYPRTTKTESVYTLLYKCLSDLGICGYVKPNVNLTKDTSMHIKPLLTQQHVQLIFVDKTKTNFGRSLFHRRSFTVRNLLYLIGIFNSYIWCTLYFHVLGN